MSGGESQRIKLVGHLLKKVPKVQKNAKGDLLLFDEPTTGLHFDDINVLLKVFHKLVDHGHSVLVIEHNSDVINCADYVIDLGPEGGEEEVKLYRLAHLRKFAKIEKVIRVNF